MCYNNTDVVDEMLNRIEISLCSNNPEKEISNIERLISKNAAKKQKLLDMRLDDTLDKDSFDIKFNELNEQFDDDGNKDPSMLTFVYKTGFTNSVDANNHKPPRKKRKKNKEKNENKLSSYSPNEDEKMCSLNSDNTRGDGMFDVKKR